MKRNMRNRLLATLLALVMVLGMLPMAALAALAKGDAPLAAVPAGDEAVANASELPAAGKAALAAEGDPDWVIAADDDSRDIGTEHYTMTAASAHANHATEGSANYAKDGNLLTWWHTEYNNGFRATEENQRWIKVELDEAQQISGFRYKPRADKENATRTDDDGNGYVTQYRVEVSEDDSTWTTVASGSWDSYDSSAASGRPNGAWQVANFEPVQAKYIKLTGVRTEGSTNVNQFMHAAEVRVVAAPEETGPVAVNVIEDPGFENTNPVLNGYFSAGRWDKNGEATARSTEQAHSGTYSLKFNNLCGTKQVISKDRLQPGTYTLSLWMYQDATAETTIRVHTGRYAANGPVLAEKARITSGANSLSWVKYSLDFVYKSGDPMIEVYNEGTSGSPGYGVAYIDDVSVILKEAAETPDPVVPTVPGEGQHYAYLSIDNEKWGLSAQPYTWTTTSSLGVTSTLQGLTVYRIESNNPTRGALMKGPGDITDGTYVILAGGSYTADKRDCNAFSYSADTGKTSAYHVGTKGLATNILYSVNSAYEVRLTQNTATGGWTIRPVADATKYLNIGAGKQDAFEELPFGAQADATEFVFLSADEANAGSAEAYKTGYMNIAAIVNDAPTPVDPPVPGEGQQYAYLGFEGPLVDGVYNRKWGIGTDSYALRLFKVPNVTTARGDEVLDGVEEGSIYYISAPSSLMRQENDSTIDKNTISNGLPPYSTYINPQGFNAETANMYRFHATADGCWTIENVGNGKYLNIGEDQLDVFNQLPFGEEASATKFVIAPCQGMGADNAMHDGFFTIAAIVDTPEVDPPAPERTLAQAIADETTDVHYLTGTPTGGNGWVGSVNEAKAVELLAPAVTENITTSTAIALTGSITSGNQYIIRGANFTNGTKCDMHISAPNTNQCGAATTTTVNCMEHLFTFTAQEDGTYKISNGANFLTTNPTMVGNRPHFLFDAEGSKYGVTAVEGQEGSYYIWWETEKVVEPDLYTPEQAVEDGKTVKYLAFTGGISDNRWWDASGTAGDTAKIQLYSAAGAETSSAITLDTDGIEAGNYVVIFGASSSKPAVMHYSAPATNQCSSSTTTVSDVLHLFTFAAAAENEWDNAFTIAPNGVAKYLSLDASGNQRLFKDEATTFYVNAVEGEQGKYYLWIAEEPEDYSGLESAQTAFSGTTQGEPFSAEDVGTQMFRIPAMITLDNGWIVAAADVRWAGWNDNPANLDTIVSVSKDGGQTWAWEVINYFGDHANSVQGLPLSAAFIDPILVQGPDGKVWMAIDATSADGKATAGSTGYDDQDRILVTHAPSYVGVKAPADPSVYTYYVDSEAQSYTLDGAAVSLKPIKSSADNAASGYAVDAFMNLYKVTGSAATREWCKQEGAEKKVQTNLFYKQSAWRVFPTCFIMLRSATVTADGLVWDDPTFPNLRYEGQTQPFFGVCPGRGAVTDVSGTKRILFPVYDNATGGEKTSVIYSDDNGATWQRGERTPVSYGGKTSESQIITLPDGTLRMYCRNAGGNRQASYTDSTDGGVTWSATQADAGLLLGSNCMYSVINVNGVLEGPNGQRYEHVVMASYPEGNGGASDWGNRSNGSLRLGYISGSTGNWTVNWLGEPKLYNGEAGTYFAYSCLTQFVEEDEIVDKFAVLYELNDNASARPNIPVDILYKEFDVAYVLGEGWSLTDGSEPAPTRHYFGKFATNDAWTMGETAYSAKLGARDSSDATGWRDISEMSPGQHPVWGKNPAGSGGSFLNPVLQNGTVISISYQAAQNRIPHQFDQMTEYGENAYIISAEVSGTRYYLTHNADNYTYNGTELNCVAYSATEATVFQVTAAGDGGFHIWYDGDATVVDMTPPAPQEFTITFNANGGEGSMAAQTVTENVAATLTANAFTRGNHTFSGWSTAANGSGTAYADGASVTATGDMILYAQWTEVVVPPTTYTVTFTGEGVAQTQVTVEENHAVGAQMPADPTRAGYTFAGWQTADGAAFTAATVVTGNVTVTAQWTEIVVPPTTCTVTINGVAYTVNAGEALGDRMPADPEDPSYTFTGWLAEETNSLFTADTVVNRDLTVVPIWSMRFCTVVIGDETISVIYGGTVGDQMPADPVRAGYTFAGWQTADGREFTADTVVAGDISVGARWTVTPPAPSGGGSSRPTPPEEDLNEPDVPLANGPLAFEDVKMADWFYADVAAVFSAGVMRGVSDTRFEPDWRLNRGMMAQVIFNLEKDPVATAANPFADVTSGNYYLEAVTWGAEQGVLKGYDNGLYGGEDQVTREQMVLMLYRYSEKKGLDLTAEDNVLAKFADGAKTSDWAADAVRWAVSKGLIQGRSNNLLDPGAAMTRAEVAAILARYVKLLDK